MDGTQYHHQEGDWIFLQKLASLLAVLLLEYLYMDICVKNTEKIRKNAPLQTVLPPQR